MSDRLGIEPEEILRARGKRLRRGLEAIEHELTKRRMIQKRVSRRLAKSDVPPTKESSEG